MRLRLLAVIALAFLSVTTGSTARRQPLTGPPKTDFVALVDRIEAVLRSHLYSEEAFQHPRTQLLLLELRHAAAAGRGHSGLVEGFRRIQPQLPYSHLDLLPPRGEDRNTQPRSEESAVRLELIRPSLSLLTIDSFNQVTPGDMRKAFQEIEKQGSETIILDLRENSGGTYSSLLLAGHLMEEPATVGALVSRPARDRVFGGDWADFPSRTATQLESVAELARLMQKRGALVGRVEPLDPLFRGEAFVLTSRRTGSACEPLVEILKRAGRATIVGEPTAGAMMSAFPFDLGQGWQIRVPVFDYVTADGLRLDGRGVAPDIAVIAGEALQEALKIAGRSREVRRH